MIEIRTVLVLGAGASHPYGFPLGHELWEKASTEDLSPIGEMFYPDRQAAESRNHILEFQRLLHESQCDSIDQFLEGRPKYEAVGKAVIADYLIRCESKADLLGAAHKENWYGFLLNELMLTDGFEGFGRNKLSIITYNYDRSLEHYILTVLQARYEEKSRAECVEALSPIPIIHVHGKLGELTERDTEGRRYENEVDLRRLKIAIRGIRIANDKTLAADPEFARARTELCSATHVIFLGFGYLKDNIDRLNLHENRREKVTKCFGTAVRLSQSKMNDILALFPPAPGKTPDHRIMEFYPEAENVRDFLDNNRHLFHKR